MRDRKFNKAEYDQQFNKQYCKRIMLSFNKTNDADILNQLDQQENKTEYIRQLIRSDIKANK